MHGFSLNCDENLLPVKFNNQQSILAMPSIAWEHISKELQAGRFAGPYTESEKIPHTRIHPIGLKPKNSEQKYILLKYLESKDPYKVKPQIKYRLIYDLSRIDHEGKSVNNTTLDCYRKVKYTLFPDIIDRLSACGLGSTMGRTDIQSAYRLLPISPKFFRVTGIELSGFIFYEKSLPFGSATSCHTFEVFSSFLEWVYLQYSGNPLLDHYLDDFFFFNSPTQPSSSPSCNPTNLAIQQFQEVCSDLGVPLDPNKTVFSTTDITLLGLGINSVLGIVYAPKDKIIRAYNVLRNVISEPLVSTKMLQSVLGLLNFLNKCVPPGRPFTRRLYAALSNKMPNERISLSYACKDDLRAWVHFLSSFNGVSYFIKDDGSQGIHFQLFTDSSTTIGTAAWMGCNNTYFYIQWPPNILEGGFSTALLEFIPCAMALFVPSWALMFQNRVLTIFSDNEATVSILNDKYTKSNAINQWLRPFILRCMALNCRVFGRWVPTERQMADSLSRTNFKKFHSQVPPNPTRVFPELEKSGLPPLESLTPTD